jgi:hypothetical protein
MQGKRQFGVKIERPNPSWDKFLPMKKSLIPKEFVLKTL